MDDKCKIYQDMLVEEALGEAGQRERTFLKAHLAKCAHCRRELALISDAVGALRREQPASTPVGLAERACHHVGTVGERLTTAASSFGPADLFRPSTWRARKSLVAWMVAASILVMSIASLVPGWMNAGDSRQIAQCQQGLRLVAASLRQYAADNGGLYPTGSKWYESLDYAYLRRQGALICPARIAIGQPSRAIVDYAYTPQRASIHSGHDYPLLWDRKGRHDRLGRNVVFASGHVMWLDEDRFEVLLAKYRIDEAEAY